MALDGYNPLLVRQFGGRCTVTPRAALPVGRSPDCADVKFVPGGVGTRDGMAAEAFGRSPFTSLSVYLGREGTERVLVHDNTGKIFVEDPAGTLAAVVSDQGDGVMNSTTLFGKQWICVSDGLRGQASPFYFDGDSIYPAGPEGPSREPQVAAVADAANGFLGTEVPGVYAWLDPNVYTAVPHLMTVTLGLPRGSNDIPLVPGTVQVWDVTHTVLRGLLTVASSDPATRTATFTAFFDSVATAVDDEILCSGNYWIGRDVRYAWLTKSGYISQLSPAGVTPYHDGLCSYDVYAVQKGPPGTVARIFFVKVQIGTELFHVASKMVLNDNTTVGTLGSPAIRISFTDDELTTGLSGEPYLNLAHLSPYAGVCSYKERLVFWRGQAEVMSRVGDYGIRNGTLNGGVDDATLFGGTTITPNGWAVTVDGVSAVLNLTKGQNGTIWCLSPSAAAAVPGVFRAWLNSYIKGLLRPTQIGLRIRARRDGTWGVSDLANGHVVATITASSGATLATETLRASDLSETVFRTVCLPIVAGMPSLLTTDTSVEVRLDFAGATSSIAKWLFDDFSFYEVGFQGTEQGPVAITKAGDPESLDATTGSLSAGPDDGQPIGCCFEIRGNLYIAKERSLFVARDAQGEPIEWPVEQVSSVCGTPSVNGVGHGDGWAVIAGLNGVFLFDGGTPQLMSYTILPDWQRINWAYGHKLWVQVDTEGRVIYIGAPVDGATECNLVYSCDFSQGLDESGRQWSLINRSISAAAVLRAREGASRLLFALLLEDQATNLIPASSETFTPATWTLPGGTSAVAGKADPLGGTNAAAWTFSGAVSAVASAMAPLTGDGGCIASIWMRVATAAESFVATIGHPISGGAPISCSVTERWTRFVYKYSGLRGAAPRLTVGVPSACTLYVFGAQLQDSVVDRGYSSGATGLPGVIARSQSANVEDFDGPIPAYYDTAPLGADIGRSSFERTILRISGDGNLPVSLVRPDGTTQIALQTFPLSAAPNNDLELGGNFQDTQYCIRVGNATQPIRNWFMTRACAWLKAHPYGLFRGKN